MKKIHNSALNEFIKGYHKGDICVTELNKNVDDILKIDIVVQQESTSYDSYIYKKIEALENDFTLINEIITVQK